MKSVLGRPASPRGGNHENRKPDPSPRALVYSPAGTDRRAEYHSIEVRVKRPRLNMLTREGYYSGLAR